LNIQALGTLKLSAKIIIGRLFRVLFSSSVFKDFNVVLMYHRVAPVLPKIDQDLFVTTASLENHIRELSTFFDIVSLDNIDSSHTRNKNKCAITFDDGWLDNYKYAYPIIMKYKIPATIFIPVANIGLDRGFWFDDLFELARISETKASFGEFVSCFKSLVLTWNPCGTPSRQLKDLISKMKLVDARQVDRIVDEGFRRLGQSRVLKRSLINWSEAMEMGKNNIAFGSHGLRHYILTNVDQITKAIEICESLKILRQQRVSMSPFFSYPNGNFDDEAVHLVARAGYLGGVTTKIGYNNKDANPYLLNRIPIHEYVGHTTSLLWFRIFQAYIAGNSSTF